LIPQVSAISVANQTFFKTQSSMTLSNQLVGIVGKTNVLTGDGAKPFLTDWTGQWNGDAAAVSARPARKKCQQLWLWLRSMERQ